jgi:predicted transcriptional regulator
VDRINGLELETRRTIYQFILKFPGVHLREISRKLNIPLSSINYHIHCLKKQDVLIAKPNGRYVRYYIAKKISESDKKFINILRQEVPFKIVIFLLTHPNSSQTEISKHLGRHSSTISFHLNKLIDIVEITPNGKEVRYRVKNEEDLFNLVSKYQDSFLKDTVGFGSPPLPNFNLDY